jgi:myo-inositol-1(or 4)-monophosphatase
LVTMRPELQIAIEAARRAGELTLRDFDGDFAVQNKNTGRADRREGRDLRAADYDPVTSADRAADCCLREALLGAFPDYGWLSEETVDSPERLDRKAVWIVDPLDGTKEFVSGIQEYAVSVALVEDGEPTVAVIFNPPRDELYSAVKGGGTFVNGKRVFCTPTPALEQAVLIVSRSEASRGEIDPLRPHLREIRPLGSVAYKLAVVAAGEADLNVSVQPKNEWDVCAGDLLVREAGGHMVDLNGVVRRYNQPDPLIRGGLAAANPGLADLMVALVSDVAS